MEFFNAIFRANQVKLIKKRLDNAERHRKYLANVYRYQRQRQLTLINDLVLVLNIETEKPKPRINIEETRLELAAAKASYNRFSDNIDIALGQEDHRIAILKQQIEKLEAPQTFRNPKQRT